MSRVKVNIFFKDGPTSTKRVKVLYFKMDSSECCNGNYLLKSANT